MVALLLLALMPTPTLARWTGPTDPTLSAWYSAQHNAKGQYCCDRADGHDFYGAYAIDTNGDVEFDANGIHHHLPAYMVLNAPNPTGHAVWWYADADSGHVDYCFAPGAAG